MKPRRHARSTKAQQRKLFPIPVGLSLSPRWGDAATGGGALWQEQVYRRYLPEAMGDAWALDARSEYGVRLPSGGLPTWFGSLSQSAYGKRFAVDGRVGMQGSSASVS